MQSSSYKFEQVWMMLVFCKMMLIFLQEIMAKMFFQFHLSIVETFYIPINLKSTSSTHKGATEINK
jgi:hypothetical protein